MNGLEDRGTLEAMTSLAMYYDQENRLGEAIALQEQSLVVQRRVIPPADSFFQASLGHLVKLYEKAGRAREAEILSGELSDLQGRGTPLPPFAALLIPPGSEWRWLHPTDGVDPAGRDPDFHRSFFGTGYDDSSWQSGRDAEGKTGGFGYGEDWFRGVDIGTPEGEPDSLGRHQGGSAYFRHRFTTDREHRNLELRCEHDDGIIVYLDGREVARDNMRDGEESYRLPSARPISGNDETTTRRITLAVEGGVLPAGEHVLAISLHNTEDPSSDLRIGGITLGEGPPDPK
jgi:hypothetical protein